MKEDTLLDMVSHMTDDVALVHQMPFACDREGFAATLEKVILYIQMCSYAFSYELLRLDTINVL